MTGEFQMSALDVSAPMERASSPPISGVLSRLLGGWMPSKRAPVSPSPFSDVPDSQGPGRSERVFDRVIALQHADGSWELDEALLIACGLPPALMPVLEAFVHVTSREEGTRAMAMATALTFLRRRAAADQAEWGLLGRKAERYLAQVAIAPNGGGTWLDAASGVFISA
jgi:hypothetical protein